MKKVSLMMTTYNSADNLKKTFACVRQQDYPDMEIVIVDGGSKDGTLDIIKRFSENSGMEVKWVSERDNGLYDAMNKAVRMAEGDYLLVFNDQFIDNSAISKLVQAAEEKNCDGAHADLIYAEEDRVRRYWHMAEGTLRNGWMPGHPTLLLKRQVYETYGQYDTSFKIAADYDFMVRILRGGVRLAYVPEILVRMYYGGTSTAGVGNYIDSFKEGHRALANNGVKCACFIDIIRTFRVLSQFLFRGRADKIWSAYQKNMEGSGDE